MNGPSENTHVLVLGIGNLIMADDGVGIRVIQHLTETYRFPAGVSIIDGGTLGPELLPRLDGISRLLVVDAVETGAAPGTLVRLAGAEINAEFQIRLSPHQMGLRDLLFIAELQGYLPEQVVLLGVQPGIVGLGVDLSPPVAEQIDPLVAAVIEELDRWGIKAERKGEHDRHSSVVTHEGRS